MLLFRPIIFSTSRANIFPDSSRERAKALLFFSLADEGEKLLREGDCEDVVGAIR